MLLCSAACRNGRFGLKCGGICRCKNNDPCDQQTGYCTAGCSEGFMGEACQTRKFWVNQVGTCEPLIRPGL